MSATTDFETARYNMVESQIRPNDVTDRRLIDAIASVAREEFLPAGKRAVAYMDEDVLIGSFGEEAHPRYLIEPMPFARLVQAADVKSSDLVLDVGCATGYTAAVLAQLGDSVVALESAEDLAAMATETLMNQGNDNVAVVTGTLRDGYPSEGPYDVIFLSGSVDSVPDKLLDQLSDGGRLVAVVGGGPVGKAMLYVRHDNATSGRVIFDASIPPLPGFREEPGFVF